MKIKEYLKVTAKVSDYGMMEIRERVICDDGFSMSVQASKSHYCHPRVSLFNGEFECVEIGFPSQEEELINEYAECPDDYTGSVYGYVPVEIVDAVLIKHGGIKK